MKPILVTSRQGGTGKSTVAVGVAQGLSIRGKKTCLVEADVLEGYLAVKLGVKSGRTLSEYLRQKDQDVEITAFISGGVNLPSARKKKPLPSFDCIFGSDLPDREVLEPQHWLAMAKKEMQNLIWYHPPLVSAGLGTVWRKLGKAGYEYCLIDCPPGLSPVTSVVLHSLSKWRGSSGGMMLHPTHLGPSLMMLEDLMILRGKYGFPQLMERLGSVLLINRLSAEWKARGTASRLRKLIPELTVLPLYRVKALEPSFKPLQWESIVKMGIERVVESVV